MSKITPYEPLTSSFEDFIGIYPNKSSPNNSITTKDSRFPLSEYYNPFKLKISKKTNRGRKENFSLPKDLIQCDICLKYSDFSEEQVISCAICKGHFHKSCYSQYEMINSTSSDSTPIYKCIRCIQAEKLNKNINDKDFNCFICGYSDKVLNYNPLNRNYYHKICLLFLPELNNLTGEEISKEKIRKWRYKNSCKYCGEKLSKSVAVIKCKKPKCKDFYHIPCAIEKGMIFDLNFMKQYYNNCPEEQIPFYCSNHNKKIANQYKNFVMDKIKNKENNEKSEDKKEEKKTFSNDEDSIEDQKMEEVEEMDEDESMEELYKSEDSISLTEEDAKSEKIEDVINPNVKINNDDIPDEEKEEEKFVNMDLDQSSNLNNDVFHLDFEKILKEIKLEMNNGDFLSELNTGNNINNTNINVDQFCLNKKSGLYINRQNSINFYQYN
jgi:hypothetical protein